MDYAATRDDIGLDQLSYFGFSWGGALAPIMLATENRVRAAVILVGALLMQETQPVADPSTSCRV